MSRKAFGTGWLGLALIGLGAAFLLAQVIGWDRIWPVFPLLGGLAFFAGYVASGFREEGFVFVGTAATLIGLFFFGFTLGYWEWGEMEQLWPVFPLIGGLAFIALFLADRTHDLGVLGVGLVAAIVGVAGLAATHDLIGLNILKLWPLLLIFLGLFGLAGALRQMFRQR